MQFSRLNQPNQQRHTMHDIVLNIHIKKKRIIIYWTLGIVHYYFIKGLINHLNRKSCINWCAIIFNNVTIQGATQTDNANKLNIKFSFMT